MYLPPQIFNLYSTSVLSSFFSSIVFRKYFWDCYRGIFNGASYSSIRQKGLFPALYFNPLIKAAELPISRTFSCTLNDALNSPNKRLRLFCFSSMAPLVIRPIKRDSTNHRSSILWNVFELKELVISREHIVIIIALFIRYGPVLYLNLFVSTETKHEKQIKCKI